jgi:hypothetical protein
MNTAANLATTPRAVIQTLRGQPASDGAGVKLSRVIGQPKLPDLDPFLLLDEFGTDKAEDYIAGFPEHPHRALRNAGAERGPHARLPAVDEPAGQGQDDRA